MVVRFRFFKKNSESKSGLAANQNLHQVARISRLLILRKRLRTIIQKREPRGKGERGGNYYSLSAIAGSFAATIYLSPHNRLADCSAAAAGHALCCELGCLALKAIRYPLHDDLNNALSEFQFTGYSAEFSMRKQQPASLPPMLYFIRTKICNEDPKSLTPQMRNNESGESLNDAARLCSANLPPFLEQSHVTL